MARSLGGGVGPTIDFYYCVEREAEAHFLAEPNEIAEGQTPIVPRNGAIGIAMSSRRCVTAPAVRSKIFRYGSGKSSGSSPSSGRIAVQPQPSGCRSRISIASV
jgi:hypothetical protein